MPNKCAASTASCPTCSIRPGRRQVLAKLLAAPVLYHTPALRAELDAAARRNLAAELAELG